MPRILLSLLTTEIQTNIPSFVFFQFLRRFDLSNTTLPGESSIVYITVLGIPRD